MRLALVLALAVTAAAASDKGAPPTPVRPVTDTYHGVSVTDPYRWLEDAADPAVQAWSEAQDARTRAWLDKTRYRGAIHRRLETLIGGTGPSFHLLYPAGGKIFALYVKPPAQQPMLATLGEDADPAGAKIVLDPNTLDASGGTAIDWFVPSPDGSKVAVSLSKGGSEDGTLHVFDTASGRDTGLRIPRVQFPTGGGSLAWKADGSGFYYTRYPGPERPDAEQHFFQRLYFHHMGDDPARDALVLGQDFPRVAEIFLDNRQNPDQILVAVANGDGGQFEHFVIGPDGKPRQVTRFEDQVVGAVIGPDNILYLTSRQGAPRGKILTLPLADLTLAHARTLIPESDGVIRAGGEFGGVPVTITRRAIYIRELIGGPSRLAAYDHAGKRLADVPVPPIASVDEVVATGGGVLAEIATYLRPPYFERYDEASGAVSETKLAETSPVHFDDVTVSREFATSKDGTRIPVNIIARRGTARDGKTPTLLYGYGGYNVAEEPEFLGAHKRVWLDGQGVYAIANIRGGGEYGEAWHAQGALTHKQNVFDDFAAAAEYLIAQHVTSSDRLATMGGSNGGLLQGAFLTQHPALAHAVVSLVGIYDMLRVERDPNGAFNVTEFGSTADPAQFQALYGYSPYHHVRNGVAYPAVFMATGENDGRVNPAHSRKMIAALQAATSSDQPILLSINSHAGHGIGSALSIRIDQQADVLAFLFQELEMTLPEGHS